MAIQRGVRYDSAAGNLYIDPAVLPWSREDAGDVYVDPDASFGGAYVSGTSLFVKADLYYGETSIASTSVIDFLKQNIWSIISSVASLYDLYLERSQIKIINMIQSHNTSVVRNIGLIRDFISSQLLEAIPNKNLLKQYVYVDTSSVEIFRKLNLVKEFVTSQNTSFFTKSDFYRTLEVISNHIYLFNITTHLTIFLSNISNIDFDRIKARYVEVLLQNQGIFTFNKAVRKRLNTVSNSSNVFIDKTFNKLVEVKNKSMYIMKIGEDIIMFFAYRSSSDYSFYKSISKTLGFASNSTLPPFSTVSNLIKKLVNKIGV